MRPVILSRPENTAVGLAMLLRRRLDHHLVAGLRRGIGGLRRRASRLTLARRQAGQGRDRAALLLLLLLLRDLRPVVFRRLRRDRAPGGGASGCDWIEPPPGLLAAAGSSAPAMVAPAANRAGPAAALGTSAGGRGGAPRKIWSNCATAGCRHASAAAVMRPSEKCGSRHEHSDFPPGPDPNGFCPKAVPG